MGTTGSIASALGNTTNTTNTTANTSSGSNALSLASNFNTFLTLLTTQLQNQDPTNPVDSNQFTQQLVEFAGVQQQVQSNTTLSQILTALQGTQISSASSYIGTDIQATGDQVGITTAGGTGTLGYTLPSTAASATVTIKDSNGNTVFTSTNAPTASGSNIVEWNGTNSITGAAEPAGTYTFSVTAKDAQGKAITATPFITGTVSSASISNGSVLLDVGGLSVPVGNVTSITNLPGTTNLSSGQSGTQG